MKKTQIARKKMFGFTLLELLVVISIIGILIAMGVAAFSVAQRRARDARRRADLKSMQGAFEQYFSVNTRYAACSTMATADYLPGGLPKDPKTAGNYSCTPSGGSATEYCVCATLEGSDGNSNANNCGGLGTTGSYFCVKNLQ